MVEGTSCEPLCHTAIFSTVLTVSSVVSASWLVSLELANASFTPQTFMLPQKVKIPNASKRPATTNSNPCFLWSLAKEVPNHRAKSPGKVPRANATMSKPPVNQLPVANAMIWTDWVNQHGRKKVNAQTKGASNGWRCCNILLVRRSGACSPRLLSEGTTSKICSHR